MAMQMDPDDIDARERPATIMNRIAKGDTDEEIGVMAEFFSSKTYILAKQNADGGMASKGKSIHKEACGKCHEDGGRKADGSGILAGKWMRDLKNEVVALTEGQRAVATKMRAQLQNTSAGAFDATTHR